MRTSIAPWLSVRNGEEAVEFYRAAFGAQELYCIEDPSGAIVAKLGVNGAEFWVSDGSGNSARLVLTVADPPKFYEQAITAGAKQVTPVYDEHGWLVGKLEDPFGHHWEIGRPVDAEVLRANRSVPDSAVIPELPYANIEEAIAWLTRVFGFRLRVQIGDHRAQMHAGDGDVVLTEKGRSAVPASVMVRVANAKAHHDRAKAAGANITQAPTDFPYGERQYAAVDLAGHHWHFTESIADVHPADWGGSVGEL